jgi:hypothetical protein
VLDKSSRLCGVRITGFELPFAAGIPKKKKTNYFDNYSGFADF